MTNTGTLPVPNYKAAPHSPPPHTRPHHIITAINCWTVGQNGVEIEKSVKGACLNYNKTVFIFCFVLFFF